MKYLSLLLLALLSLPLQAQLPASSPVLHLRSGTYQFPANFSRFVSQPEILPGEVVAGHYLRWVQFNTLPTSEERAQLAAAGLELLQYYPSHTYLAAVSTTANRSQWLGFDLRSAHPVLPGHKLHPDLVAGIFPPDSRRGDRVAVNLLYHGFIPAGEVRAALLLAGAVITRHLPQRGLMEVEITPDQCQALAALPHVAYMEPLPPPGEPEDTPGRSLHRANVIDNDLPGGLRYDGTGVGVAVRDDGLVGPHIDFAGRLDQTFASGTSGSHGDGVAGIVGAAGNLDPRHEGMATGAFIYVMNYEADFLDSTVFLHRTENMVITNSSYSNGCNDGYTIITQTVDAQAVAYPSLLHVFSAGNSNGSNCGYGAGSQWGNITGGHKQGKNVIATANVFADDELVNSSSRGPAHDGRIKPDIAANGQNQISTDPNNGYSPFGGTSGAAPGIAGVAAQLYQAYREFHSGADPSGALIKAVLLNTAYDLGNPGPDFRFGWGRVDAGRALHTLAEDQWLEGSVDQGDSATHVLTLPPGLAEVRVMVYWLDPAAAPNTTRALVNDLDIQLSGNGTTYLPWVLNHLPNATTLNQPATTGIDSLNNVEQVALLNPAPGTYTLSVRGKAVPQGPQAYFVVYDFRYDAVTLTYPMGGERLVPGETARIRWDADGDANATFALRFSADSGATWQPLVSGLNGSTRHWNWNVPNQTTAGALIQVVRQANGGTTADTSQAPFFIYPQVTNLNLVRVCPNQTTFSWSAVSGATAYEIFQLGEKYMEPIDTIAATPNPSYSRTGIGPDGTYWFAVRAHGPQGVVGRRSLALERPPGRFNCAINNDLAVTGVNTTLSPVAFLRACYGEATAVRVSVANAGSISLSGFNLNYQRGSGPVVTEPYPSTLAPQATGDFIFAQPLALDEEGALPLRVWTSLAADTVPYNDSAALILTVLPGEVKVPPFREDFESLIPCDPLSDCGDLTCALGAGWVNMPSSSVEQLDWRVGRGHTPTSGTGPGQDFNPGSPTGTYLYLEGDESCLPRTAFLLSPCIDLTGMQQPELSLRFHFYGDEMGSLWVDVYDGTNWTPFVIPAISGNRGDQWWQGTVNLTPFAGKLVTLRFRGYLGGSRSDMALDDVAVYERGSAAPMAAISVDRDRLCPGEAVTLTDISLHTLIGTRAWRVQPGGATFINGTGAQAAQPQVVFPGPGLYTVTLTVTNAHGIDSATTQIWVDPGEIPPLAEDFEGGLWPPVGWELALSSLHPGWEPRLVPGADSVLTTAATLPWPAGPVPGDSDQLWTPVLDLRGADAPWVYFDRAYAGTADILELWVAPDCGAGTPVRLWVAGGSLLATAATGGPGWAPATASDWRRDSVDLSAFADQSIRLYLVAIAGSGQARPLYVDNFRWADRGMPAPVAAIESLAGIACAETSVVFSDASGGGPAVSHAWNFGSDATPAVASGPGPHAVVFASSGVRTVSLTVANGSGSTSIDRVIEVLPAPDARFSFSGDTTTFTFTPDDASALGYFWDFGDGSTSTEIAPVHTFPTAQPYPVTLIVTNACGTDTAVATLVNLDAPGAGWAVNLRPNPGTGPFELMIEAPTAATWQVDLYDLRGRQLHTQRVQATAGRQVVVPAWPRLAQGLYLVRVQGQAGQATLRLLVP